MNPKQKKKKGSLENDKIAYLLIAPSYLIYLLFVLIPIGWTIVMSFTDFNLRDYHFIGFTNYINLFSDSVFVKSLWNTIKYSLMTIPLAMALALCLAYLLNQKMKARGLFRTLFYLPNIFSMVAVSMAWLYLYDTNSGIINKVLNDMGLGSVGWVSNAGVALISVAIMSIWNSTGYNMILFLSGLQGIPDYLYEAASIDRCIKNEKVCQYYCAYAGTYYVFCICYGMYPVFSGIWAGINTDKWWTNGFDYNNCPPDL